MKGIGSRVNANRVASVPCSRSEKIWLRPASDPICSDPGRGKCRPETKDAILQPRLPRKVERRHREPSAPPEPAQCRKCHACHAKCRSMHQVPRLPRKVKVDVAKCRACLAKSSGVTRNQARHQSQPSAVSATPARQSAGRCTKCHACHAK